MSRGGRPRDPKVDGRIIDAATRVLAWTGRLNADEIATEAGVGKASIYRRWRTIEALLVDVVLDLGVRDVDHGDGPGTVRDDLARVLHTATTGLAAAAETAVLSQIGRCTELQMAYIAGPATRLVQAANAVEVRGRRRGEPEWSSFTPVLAGHRFLMHRLLAEGSSPFFDDVLHVVDAVVLPALLPPLKTVSA